VVIGADTYSLVRGAVDAELLPPLEAKGKSLPLTAYRIRALTGEGDGRGGAPMVGRRHELELLRRAYERSVHEGACHLFTVLGSAGIGKSRLVDEFLAELDAARVVRGRCLAYGEGITYWPVVEIVKQLGRRPAEEAVRGPLDALLGAGDAVTSPAETAWAVRKALEAAALDGPLVVVFDDIQWGEPAFLDLIEHVADLSRGSAILVVCMARPELLDVRPGWGGGKHNATSVLLEPLGADEAVQLVRALAAADDELAERIGAAAEGNPLFIEEMVELARESGGEVSVPPTIQALLAARLDSLPPEERTVLERGAVEGQVFHRGAVAALAPEEPQVDTRLAGLVRKELVRPETPTIPTDDAYRFRHLLIRDAAYEALPKVTRIELHERFATWLEEHGAALVELDEIVGYHLEQAVRYARELERPSETTAERAGVRLAGAARRAEARGDVAAAANLAGRAERLLARDDPRRHRLLPMLGRALHETGQLEESRSFLDEAVASADPVASGAARAIRASTRVSIDPGFRDAGLAEATAAVEQLTASGDDASLADAYISLARLRFWGGRLAGALEAAEHALAHGERAGDQLQIVEALALKTNVMDYTDAPIARREEFARHLLGREDLGPRVRARALVTLGRCAAERAEFAEARSLFAAAVGLAEEIGLATLAAGMYQTFAKFEWLSGDIARMEGAARSSWDGLGALGEVGVRSTSGAVLAFALALGGRDGEADEIVSQAVAMGDADDHHTTLWAALARSRIASNRGAHAEAVALARRALAAVADEETFHRMITLVGLAEALVAADELEEARRTVEEVEAFAARRESPAFGARARAVLVPAPQQ
jgi:predicted ATPase